MKQKDIALILVIVFVSGVVSLLASNKFISPPKHDEKAAQVEAIMEEFKQPDQKYFNEQSVNPTQPITIGGTDPNQNPFNSR